MSKWSKTMGYLDAKTELSVFDKKDREYMGIVFEALKIADKLEQINSLENNIIYQKSCNNVCTPLAQSECAHRKQNRYCLEVDGYIEGYNDAISDLRGDNNDGV